MSAKTRIFHDESWCASSADAAELVSAEIIAHMMIAVNDLHALIDTLLCNISCTISFFETSKTEVCIFHLPQARNKPQEKKNQFPKPKQNKVWKTK